MLNKVHINCIKHISSQQPLVDDWFEHPSFHLDSYVRALEPDYKQYFSPNEARRLGKILKRALLVSRLAMSENGVPDAIITGTGLGCIENTEIFLNKLVREGEELLNPTHFMQSTHNTISSLIAIDAKCYSYNSTYAHKGISFECALLDAFIQLKNDARHINTALVGAHDEMTPSYFTLLKKSGYLGKPNQTFAGETAVAMMLSVEKTEKTLCEIEAVEKVYGLHHFDKAKHFEGIDAILVGTNGVEENDKIYFENCAQLFPNVPLMQYKNIFGEGLTVPALGVYAAATCLKKGIIPEHLLLNENSNIFSLRKIMCYNHFEGKNHTFILLSKC